MKIHNLKKWAFGAAVFFSVVGCTDNFEDFNKEKTGGPENFYADYKAIVSPLKSMQTSLKNDTQLFPNLSADMYSGMFSTATQFNGGKNNLTYFMMDGWNNRIVQHQQALFNNSIIIDKAAESQYSNINFDGTFAVKKILRVISAARVSDVHGPVVYSKYEKPNSNGITDFDSQQDAYRFFIEDLTIAANNLYRIGSTPNTVNAEDKAVLELSDLVYGGNMLKWAKLANSLKLRMAMRMSYADPAKSKLYAEEALNSPIGLVVSNC